MPESESEDEILNRIEIALRKIASATQGNALAPGQGIDREALAGTLDVLIERLRSELDLPASDKQSVE
ncbi:MAG TPA: hypothetical protein PLY97_05210 [Acidocella sp.]|nr:hypothetical protein [Acidocella sp.]